MKFRPIETLKTRFGAIARNPMMLDALKATTGYLRKHPMQIWNTAKHAVGMKLVVPLDALRWVAEKQTAGKKDAPKDLRLGGTSGGALSLAATSAFMGNSFFASADVKLDEIIAAPDELKIAIRINNLKAEAIVKTSPMAQMLGVMDFSKPANLLNFLPAKPPAIASASGDRFVIDLLKVPKVASNTLVRRLLEILAPVLHIGEVATEGDNLVVSLRPRMAGFYDSIAALRR
jgi:hypothetical protein